MRVYKALYVCSFHNTSDIRTVTYSCLKSFEGAGIAQSVVSLATTLRAERFGVRAPMGATNCVFPTPVNMGAWADQVSCTIGTGSLSRG